MSASTLVDAGFHWDGTTSDLAQQFYRRFQANDVVGPLQLSSSSLPYAIQKRLDGVDMTFSQLPGLLQRALVWDAGFTVGPENQLIGIQTLNGVSTAEIAVSKTDYEIVAGCSSQPCTQPDGATWYKSLYCNGTQMGWVSRCLAAPFTSSDMHLSMWATGGADTAIPELRIIQHVWSDSEADYVVSAIHTASMTDEPPYSQCAMDKTDRSPHVGALVIPCYAPQKISSSVKAKMKDPAPGPLVTAWLRDYANEASKRPDSTIYASGSKGREERYYANATASPSSELPSSSTSKSTSHESIRPWLILSMMGLVILGLCAALLWWCRRRERNDELEGVESTRRFRRVRSPPKRSGSSSTPTVSSHDSDSLSSNPIVKILLGDPHLMGKQIPFQQLLFDQLVSTGGFGEVWVGYSGRRVVALKRLLRRQHHSFEEIEMFAQEIQLSATLEHPNIIQFLGVAWNSIENLVMVMEYLPSGDLTHILRTRAVEMTWENEKIAMARGLASALAYLHSQSPVVIHRDLKSKNVLLSESFVPKLIDFGVSRRKLDETMTAGVGTPFWTAPEVLKGTRYTEKSDIYSFGVLLAELDTCEIPYYDAMNVDGAALKYFEIQGLVAAAHVRFRDELVPKLIDSGVSRRIQDKSMTARVGTPFWIAPEILEGTLLYTEKSDIHSLSVLTELDTCQLPYYGAVGEDGVKLKHFQILNLIMAGSLRPSLTGDTPDFNRKVVTKCLQQDAAT